MQQPNALHRAAGVVPGCPPLSPAETWTEREGLRFAHRIIEHPQPEFRPTLFVSGAFQTMDSWTRFAKAFAPHTTVMLVDPPGMGRSDVLPPEYGLDFLAGCIRQIIDERGLDCINVVAASYGTPAAFRLAQLHPDRVDRVVLAGTMRQIPPHLHERTSATVTTARRGDRHALADQVIGGLLCRDPLLPVDRRAVAERVLRSNLVAMSDREVAQYAANTLRLLQHEPLDLTQTIVGPEALVFTGEHDPFTLPAECRTVAEAFDNAWFTTIDRADHLFHIEQFEVVAGLLLRFMRGRLSGPVEGCGPLVRRSRAQRALEPGAEWVEVDGETGG